MPRSTVVVGACCLVSIAAALLDATSVAVVCVIIGVAASAFRDTINGKRATP